MLREKREKILESIDMIMTCFRDNESKDIHVEGEQQGKNGGSKNFWDDRIWIGEVVSFTARLACTY